MTMIPPPGPPGPPDEPPQDGGGTATEPIPIDGVHPHDGLPAPDIVGAGSGPERPTRKPLPMWDRVKFLLLFFLLFWFFVWSEYSDPNPFNTFGDAVQDTLRSKVVAVRAGRRRAAAPGPLPDLRAVARLLRASGPSGSSAASSGASAA